MTWDSTDQTSLDAIQSDVSTSATSHPDDTALQDAQTRIAELEAQLAAAGVQTATPTTAPAAPANPDVPTVNPAQPTAPAAPDQQPQSTPTSGTAPVAVNPDTGAPEPAQAPSTPAPNVALGEQVLVRLPSGPGTVSEQAVGWVVTEPADDGTVRVAWIDPAAGTLNLTTDSTAGDTPGQFSKV